jgi:hypothetical protein
VTAAKRPRPAATAPPVEATWRQSEDADRLRRLAALLFEDRPLHADGGPVELRQGRRPVPKATAADADRGEADG